MISKVLYAIEQSLDYLRRHTELQFAFVLIILLPLAFLFTSNQFLEAGRANQAKLQRDRVGLLHDAFVSILRASDFDSETTQREIDAITKLNPDITKFRVVEKKGREFLPIAALDRERINLPEENISLYQNAAVRFDESIIFEFYKADDRYWQSVRSIDSQIDGKTFFILTENSFAQVDSYLESREKSAYMALFLMYVVLLAITYWLIRLTNYRALYADAQKAIETKDLFTNMIAHELRAPLTAIKGYASMLKTLDVKDQDKRMQYTDRIEISSDRLLTIVSDLLDVARIQSGKLKVEISPVDLSEVVVSVADELSSIALEKSIALQTVGVAGVHIIKVDQKRLHQALTNLVSNAIKYTNKGTIELTLEEKHKVVELRVKDNGMGISAADQKKLFAPFFRVSSKDVSAITGTGLGMWITKQLIELNGGTIEVESIKNVGTQIVVQLPK